MYSEISIFQVLCLNYQKTKYTDNVGVGGTEDTLAFFILTTFVLDTTYEDQRWAEDAVKTHSHEQLTEKMLLS